MRTNFFNFPLIKRILSLGIIALVASITSFSCGATKVSGGLSDEDVVLLQIPKQVHVFYFNNNTVKEDGSYSYNINGRRIIEDLFRRKGYKVVFTRYRNKATFYIQMIQQGGSTTRSINSEKVVGTYRDRSGRVVGTYNKPTTKTYTNYHNRIDLYLWDPKSIYSDKHIYHIFKQKSGGDYDSRINDIINSLLQKLPNRK